MFLNQIHIHIYKNMKFNSELYTLYVIDYAPVELFKPTYSNSCIFAVQNYHDFPELFEFQYIISIFLYIVQLYILKQNIVIICYLNFACLTKSLKNQ